MVGQRAQRHVLGQPPLEAAPAAARRHGGRACAQRGVRIAEPRLCKVKVGIGEARGHEGKLVVERDARIVCLPPRLATRVGAHLVPRHLELAECHASNTGARAVPQPDAPPRRGCKQGARVERADPLEVGPHADEEVVSGAARVRDDAPIALAQPEKLPH
eukprot:5485540-Prymnesium_polylepis.1